MILPTIIQLSFYIYYYLEAIKPYQNKTMSHPQQAQQKQQQKNVQQFNKFLKNNNEVLQQKYKEYFPEDKIKITDRQPNVEKVVEFIADVFLIEGNEQSKQQNNQKQSSSKIKESLRHSFQSFLKIHKQIRQFNSTVAIQLLRYCILSNQMFAVQYETTKQPIQQKIDRGLKGANNQHSLNGKKQHQQRQQKIRKTQSKQQDKDNPSQSNEFALMNSPSQQIVSKNAKNKLKNRNSFDDGQLQNQFNFHEEFKLQLDPIQVKKNLKIVFDYYCKQQMSLAPNISFERIQRQSHMLTLNKFLLMARMMNMISGVITRQAIISKFRKISQGKKQIDFKKFDVMMSQLQIQDSTLIARAELNSPNIHVYLKTTKKPFDTQDMQPRQVIKFRAFTNKLTVHSGKMQQDLIQNLKEKKSIQTEQNKNLSLNPNSNSNSNIRMKQYSQSIVSQIKNAKDQKVGHLKDSRLHKQKQIEISKQLQSLNSKQSQIFNPKRLAKKEGNYSYDLSLMKLKKILPIEQEDEKWLSQYKIVSSIKKAQAYDQNVQKRRSFQDNQRNSVLIRDLKNRIKQIQLSENSSNGLDQTKPFLISPHKRY